MASKRLKELKDIHDLEDKSRVEVISKEDLLEVINRLAKVESEIKTHKKKDKEEKDSLKAEIEKLKLENIELKKCIKLKESKAKEDTSILEDIKLEIEKVKIENIDLKKHIDKLEESKEEGEICTLEDIKEEIKKVKEDVKNDMEVAKTGWVDIVKRNIKTQIKEEHIVNTTLEEEEMRQARRLNIRVTRLKEGASPKEDVKILGKMLGYTDDLSINKAGRVGQDTIKKRALVLRFNDVEARVTFFN